MSDLPAPPHATGGLTRHWYVACQSHELRKSPIARTLLNVPVVLFRGPNGAAAALLDRCPHRNAPLSAGTVCDGEVQCAYHGWRFNADGDCTAVPGLNGEATHRTRRAGGLPVREQQGFIWVAPNATETPVGEPFVFPHLDDPSYLVVRRRLHAHGAMANMAENALDVPHTSFLHGGLFRNDADRAQITARVDRFSRHVEAEYIGERRPTGLVGKLLSPSGGEVTHFDRFFLPAIIQVEYRIGDENHIVLNGAMTPVNDHETIEYAVVTARTRLPACLLRPLVMPFALRIFKQDQVILKQQRDTMARFGGPAFTSTEIDMVGHHITSLLRLADDNRLPNEDGTPTSRTVTLHV